MIRLVAVKNNKKFSKSNGENYKIGAIFMVIFVITSMIFTTMYSKLIANIMSLIYTKL